MSTIDVKFKFKFNFQFQIRDQSPAALAFGFVVIRNPLHNPSLPPTPFYVKHCE